MKTHNPYAPSATPETMLERLRWTFAQPRLSEIALSDILNILRAIDYTESEAHHHAVQFREWVLQAHSLHQLESHWNGIFASKQPVIHSRLASRAEIIMGQVFPAIRSARGLCDTDLSGINLLDFGTGDGQVGQKLHEKGIKVTGVDVINYRVESAQFPFQVFDGKRTSFANSSFDVVLATNVLHHEVENEIAEAEICRVLKPGGTFVVIETVPVGDDDETLAADCERTFVNDFFYNRVLHPGANVKVPGTYDTMNGWKNRLGRWGSLKSEKYYGIDIPVIRDHHWGAVFIKD